MPLPVDTRSGAVIHLFDLFERTAQRHCDRVALKADGGKGETYTYSQVQNMVKQLAVGLMSGRFASLQSIGLISENRPEWPIAYLAIVAAGKTVIPIDPSYKPIEIARIISDSRLELLLTSGSFEQSIAGHFPDLTVLSFEPESPRCWRQLQLQPEGDWRPPANTIAALIYTSGTTGAPKVVMLTHRNLIANLEGVEDSLHFDANDVFLSVLPLHHTFETTCGFLAPLMNGASVIYARSLKSKEILEDLALNNVTAMCGVPLLYDKMHRAVAKRIEEAPLHRRLLFKTLYALSSLGWKLGRKWGRSLFSSLRRRAGLHTLRMLVSGGAPLPPAVARFFNLIGIDFLQGYGMTEASPVISVNRPDDVQFGSVGLPLPNLEVKIDQPDDTGIGEILIRGESVTPGYLNNPEKTDELLAGGWLHTGDLGHFDGRHLWITGRRKNVIISAAGKNIYPEELEEKLLESPYVKEALVCGRKKEGKQGEEVRAIIYPDLEQFSHEPGFDPAAPDVSIVNQRLTSVVDAVNLSVSDYKRISGFEVRLHEFEKTSSRKIKRFMYAQAAQEQDGDNLAK